MRCFTSQSIRHQSFIALVFICCVSILLVVLSFREIQLLRGRGREHVSIKEEFRNLDDDLSVFSASTMRRWDNLTSTVSSIATTESYLRKLGSFPKMCGKSAPIILRSSSVEEKKPVVHVGKGSNAAAQYLLTGEGWYQYLRIIENKNPSKWNLFYSTKKRTAQQLAVPPVVTPRELNMSKNWPVWSQGGHDKGNWHVSWDGSNRLPNIILPSPPLWFLTIKDAFIFDYSVATCSYVLTSGGCVVPKFGFLPTVSYQKVALFCDGWCGGYFHFVFEHLPRIALIIDILNKNPEIKITLPILGGKKPGFPIHAVQYLVDVFKIQRNRLIDGSKSIHSTLTLLPMPMPCGNMYRNALLHLRKIVYNELKLSEVRENKLFKIILAERNHSRMPINWSEIVLAIKNISEIELVITQPNLSVSDQIKLFHSADIVIGPHGANLANTIWMLPSSTVLELHSYHYGNMCYYKAGQQIGIKWRFALHMKEKESTNYTIPVDDVMFHINDAMNIFFLKNYFSHSGRANHPMQVIL